MVRSEELIGTADYLTV